jgi:hypothetical protein
MDMNHGYYQYKTNEFSEILCGVREKIRSEDIRRQLGVVNIVKETEENQKKWKEDVIRMPSCNIHN